MRSATLVLVFLFGCSLNICVEFATATCHHDDDDGHDDHDEDHDDHGHDDHDDDHDDHDEEHDHDDDDEHNHSDEQNHTDGEDECDDEHDHAEDAHDDHHEWGLVIGGSLITVAPATFGILLLPFLQLCGGKLPKFVLAFGSGTILGAAVFLLLPEALHLTGEDADEEVDGTWTWGTGILAGWFFGMVLHHLVQIASAALKKPMLEEPTNEKAAAQAEEDVMKQPLFRRVNWDVVSAVFFGDLMHNFVDGISLGIAAKQCSSTFFWTLVWTTVAHEGPQEIADQAVLQEQANMKWYEGLTVNVICSLSTLIGAVISHEANIDMLFQGVLLAFGGGVYLFVALTELGHKVVHLEEGGSKAALIQSLSSVAAYAVGAVAIGLVLLEHDHCEGAGHDHSGDAH